MPRTAQATIGKRTISWAIWLVLCEWKKWKHEPGSFVLFVKAAANLYSGENTEINVPFVDVNIEADAFEELM